MEKYIIILFVLNNATENNLELYLNDSIYLSLNFNI